jgi:hypothetical protein
LTVQCANATRRNDIIPIGDIVKNFVISLNAELDDAAQGYFISFFGRLSAGKDSLSAVRRCCGVGGEDGWWGCDGAHLDVANWIRTLYKIRTEDDGKIVCVHFVDVRAKRDFVN